MSIDGKAFGILLEKRLPKVHDHLKTIGLPLEPILIGWFLCLFVNTLALETSFRIW